MNALEKSPSVADVVVVGGGAIGLSIAWRAALAGLKVTVVDEKPGRGSSWAAAGLLAPVTEVHYGEEGLLALALASAEMYPGFVGELEEASGRTVGFTANGTLSVARDADDDAVLDDLFSFQQSLGLKVERLEARECRALEPALASRIRGGLFASGDHQIDNRALVDALVVACERAGVLLFAGRVGDVVTKDGRVAGVTLSDGDSMAGDSVVLAAGCWSGAIGGLPPEAVPPVRPIKGQLLYVKGELDPPFLTHNLRGLDVYIVPRGDGRIVIGATVEEKGFDLTLTAEAVYTLLRDAYELVPGIVELELAETVVGLRPGSPDNAPLLGPTAVDGVIVATGHYRNGILLTPITAATISELLTTGVTPELIAPFSPARFVSSEAAS